MVKKQRKKAIIEISAGGIVFRRRNKRTEIAFILDPFGKWTFAKGHVEKGESLEKAAKRETEEEMGLRNLKTIAKLGTVTIWFRDRYVRRGALIHKFITYFLFQVPPFVKATPQFKEKIQKVRWIDAKDSLHILSYSNTKPVLRKALNLLRRKYASQTKRKGSSKSSFSN